MKRLTATLGVLLLLGAAGSGAGAQETSRLDKPLDAAAFEALVTGRVIHFKTEDGGYYGSEEYLQGRRVIWRDAENGCKPGQWRAVGDRICFNYTDHSSEEACWRVFAAKNGFQAIEVESGRRVRISSYGQPPLSCEGALLSAFEEDADRNNEEERRL